jgi:tetratricopeptide (TPR) repeat protein
MESVTREMESVARQIEIDGYYESGLTFFEQGDGLKAKEQFNKVTALEKDYKNVEQYLSIIKTSENNYKEALMFIKENNKFKALELLIDSEKYLIQAGEKLIDLRSQLKKEEKELENLGIKAYLEEDYKSCIFYIKRLQLINPENESAKIYLPRALMRYNAQEKFK